MSDLSVEAYKEQVVVAARTIAREGYADITVGHVSVCDRETGTMYIKRKGPAMSELEPSDVISHPINADDSLADVPHMHMEAFMHTAVYRTRPDVTCVIHSHPPYATALGASTGRLEMLAHDSIMFAEHGLPAFDDHELVMNADHANAMAAALGQSRALLLRGHGVLIVGEDVQWAVLAALTLERAIKVQTIARQLGELVTIDEASAREFFPHKYKLELFHNRFKGTHPAERTFRDEFWDYWRRIVARGKDADPRQV